MNLKEMLAKLQTELLAIKERAAKESRVFTDDEMSEIEAKSAEAAELKSKIERAEKSSALLSAIGGSVEVEPSDDGGDKPAAKSLGEHFVKEFDMDRRKGLRDSKNTTLTSTEFKAPGDTNVTPASIAPALTTVDTSIVTGNRRRLTVADLLGSETISGNAITYFVEGAVEGGFAGVGENGQKPQLHFGDLTPVTEALKKIAGYIKESDEIVEDAAWLASAINSRLLYELGLFEENQLLAGSGTGQNILGLLNRSGLQTETSANRTDNADSLFRAITKVQTGSGLDADGLVINPLDYQALRLTKDANGQYFGGGFFAGAYGQGGIIEQPPVWGLPTVVTPAIPQGTALVGAYSVAASVIRKGGVRVESTNSNEDDFTNNRITIRAEERLQLAARRPSGFVKVALSSAAPA